MKYLSDISAAVSHNIFFLLRHSHLHVNAFTFSIIIFIFLFLLSFFFCGEGVEWGGVVWGGVGVGLESGILLFLRNCQASWDGFKLDCEYSSM